VVTLQPAIWGFHTGLDKDDSEQRQAGPRIRTRQLSVNIQLKAKTPESLDSGASGRKSVNQTMSGSDLYRTGSARMGRIRVSATIHAWGHLDASRWSEGLVLHIGEPPDEVIEDDNHEAQAFGRGSVEDRALRYMGMLSSGKVASRAELARRIAVSRSYVTKVLRRLPAVNR